MSDKKVLVVMVAATKVVTFRTVPMTVDLLQHVLKATDIEGHEVHILSIDEANERYGTRDPQRDRRSLLGKPFEEKVLRLRYLCRNYGVTLVGALDGKAPNDVNKTVMTKICPVHGTYTQQLGAMTLRGNFGCHQCAKSLKSGERLTKEGKFNA